MEEHTTLSDSNPDGAGWALTCEVTDELLDALAVLVDGPFIESRKDISLKFRGSDNQRLIDMPATRRGGEVVLLA